MAKAMILNSILFAYVGLVSLSLCDPSTEAETRDGFTVDLIHIDSPQSPSYNPSLSPSQRLVNSLKRSFKRLQYLNNEAAYPAPHIINGAGEYFMQYSVGSPPVPALGVVDTGSDIIWTQCHPCIKCFNQTSNLFQPNTSSTYARLPCNAPSCNSMKQFGCTSRDNYKYCLYSERYQDGSYTQGELATDTFTVAATPGGNVSLPNVLFGCGFRNDVFFQGGESGIVGLGYGHVSLIRQLGPLAQGKFSYCMAPFSSSGKLSFGAKAVVSGVTTPLVKKDSDNYYHLTLDGISVGNERMESWSPGAEGNIVIDSGTTMTMLPAAFYAKVVNALVGSIKLKRVKDPNGMLDLCYSTRQDVEIPDFIVHFRGGDVMLKYENLFVRINENMVCLTALPVKRDNVGIYGNWAQINFLVGYDLEKGTVSFSPTHCAK